MSSSRSSGIAPECSAPERPSSRCSVQQSGSHVVHPEQANRTVTEFYDRATSTGPVMATGQVSTPSGYQPVVKR
jgi:hypothetical protein